MPSAFLLWIFTRALVLPHEPLVVPLTGRLDLPAGERVFGLVETAVTPVTSDRFDASGSGVGVPAKIGAYGGSWTETTYRLGALELTNPLRPGTPMVLPMSVGFASASVTAAASLPDASATGVRVGLDPLEPGETRATTISGMFMAPRWAARRTTPPAIASMQSGLDGGITWSGPLVPQRVGAVFAAQVTRATRLELDRAVEQPARMASGLMHLVFTPREHQSIKTLAIFQEAQHPLDTWLVLGDTTRARDRMGLAHVTWSRSDPMKPSFVLAAGYQRSLVDAATATAVPRIDSVLDGAVAPLLFEPAGTARVFRASATLARSERLSARHAWRVGARIESAHLSPTLLAAPGADETVAGVAARAWRVAAGPGTMAWRQSTASVFASDRVSYGSRAHLEASVRLETLRATNGHDGTVAWTDIYPRIDADVRIGSSIVLFANLSRGGMPLPPLALAFGDPAAPTGQLYKWADSNGDGRAGANELGSLIAQLGPGRGATNLSQIASSTTRPYLSQAVAGIGVDRPSWTLAVSAVLRNEYNLLRVANTGAAYSLVSRSDPGIGYPGPDGVVLTAFNRLPATFGQDRYVLSNDGDATSTFEGLDLSFALRSRHATLAFGATAARTDATSLGRGFRADENDPVLLELTGNPNGAVNAAGRPFFDRGYTGKVALALHLPADTRAGFIVRYQDGQPFSRLAVMSGLDQGAEPLSAYPRGRTRFTFVGTVDARLQKRFTLSGTTLDVVLDVFDLLNSTREVEELVVTDARFRNTSAVEPPRSAQLGFRLGF